MNATIYDIAREAGVSIATVSRVFNNNSKVTPKTREKILAIAQELGYHPRAQAQSLARRSTKIITAIVPIISNYFFMEVLAGMQDELSVHDYDLQIHNIKTADDMDAQVEYAVKRGMSEGFVIISIHFEEEKWARFKRYGVPITLVDEYYSEFDSVSVNSIDGAYKATLYLLNQGFKRIAMICANPDSKPVKDRTHGYCKAIEERGYKIDQELLFTGMDTERDGFTEQNGYEAMKKMLASGKDIDACFCASDIQALGAVKAMHDAGRNIPIVGFDDLSFSKYLGLTTMRQPMYDMGKLAVDKLIKRIKNKNQEISYTVFSPELIVRNTSPGIISMNDGEAKTTSKKR